MKKRFYKSNYILIHILLKKNLNIFLTIHINGNRKKTDVFNRHDIDDHFFSNNAICHSIEHKILYKSTKYEFVIIKNE